MTDKVTYFLFFIIKYVALTSVTIYILHWIKEVIRIKSVTNGPCKALKREAESIHSEMRYIRTIALAAYKKANAIGGSKEDA